MKKLISTIIYVSLTTLLVSGGVPHSLKVVDTANGTSLESQVVKLEEKSGEKNQTINSKVVEAATRPVVEEKQTAAVSQQSVPETAPSPAPTPASVVEVLLKQGDSGEKVVVLQKKLYNIGYTIIVDGDFGNKTSELLKAFQKTKGIDETGNYDKKTEEALISMKDTRTYTPPQPTPASTPNQPSTEVPKGYAVLPDIKTSPGDAQQVIVVLAQSYGTIRANFKTYEKVNGLWQDVDSGSAVTGMNGFSDNRHEGDKTSPTGKYEIPFLFGNADNPGVKLPYRKVKEGDYWVSNQIIEEYNVWMHYEGTDPKTRLYDYEALWQQPLYKYAAVIDFNYGDGKIMGKGSGIFLHIAPYSGGGTLGCIGVSETNLVKILKWLDPAKKPVIIMGVKGNI